MNLEKLKALLTKAEFCLWADEPWAAPGALVDWAAQYDKELLQLVELIVMDCAVRARGPAHMNGDYYKGRQDAAKLILESWDIKD